MPTIKPVLFVLTSHGVKGSTGEPTGFWLGEVTHPLHVLKQAGIPVVLSSIQGGEPPVDGFDLSDEVNAHYWADEGFRARLRETVPLADVDPADFSAIIFAGGHGAVWDFPEDEAVQRQIRAIWEAGGIVAAVCHGPAALVNARLSDGSPLVAGRKVAAFTDSEEDEVGLTEVVPFLLSRRLAERGARMQAAPDWTPQVAVDGRLVTGQNPQSATGVGEAVRDLVRAGVN
ncbi:MAG TPA: type 1 glutamine amidotransferase domain-containing protein [Paracoccus sp. (in: a-proteobacteria)]|nr:type 1 glutamine amidotransferase domain-containing protein [Paracoccus sp. (in: a-proteobacteria)]